MSDESKLLHNLIGAHKVWVQVIVATLDHSEQRAAILDRAIETATVMRELAVSTSLSDGYLSAMDGEIEHLKRLAAEPRR